MQVESNDFENTATFQALVRCLVAHLQDSRYGDIEQPSESTEIEECSIGPASLGQQHTTANR